METNEKRVSRHKSDEHERRNPKSIELDAIRYSSDPKFEYIG